MRVQKALDSSDVEQRRAAAGRVGDLSPEAAAPLLDRALDDGDARVRLAAAESAVHLRSERGARRVLGWLKDADPRIRATACEVLRAVPSTQAAGPLGRALGDSDAGVRAGAAAALGAQDSPEAIGALIGHLDDPSPEVRVEIVLALGHAGDRRAAVPLMGRLSDPIPEVRRVAARALGELGDPRAVSSLVLAVHDSSLPVRVAGVLSLGRLRAEMGVLAIAPLLEEREKAELRAAALAALGAIGSDAAVRVLVRELGADDPSAPVSLVRNALVAAGPRAIGPLLALLDAREGDASSAGAALVLGEMRAAASAPKIALALRSGRVPPGAALGALAALGDRSTTPAVLEMLADSRREVRRAAVRALTALLDPREGDGRAIEPLAAVLADPSTTADERALLAQALGRTGSPRALGVLVPLARIGSADVRLAALEALAALGPVGQDDVLFGALDDDDPRVRAQAGLALARAAAPSRAEELLDRLTRAAGQDRTAVGIALSGVLERAEDSGLVAKIRGVFEDAADPGRDALLEGLGRMHAPAAGSLLSDWARSLPAPSDRAKIAEALAGHPSESDTLVALLSDPAPSVRASAAWSLGSLTGLEPARRRAGVERLVKILADPEADVAADAAASIGRLGRPDRAAPRAIAGALCARTGDPRPYVRANLLVSLASLSARCSDPGVERALLLADPSPAVRRRAAALLLEVPSGGEAAREADAKALARCVMRDRDGLVAVGCRRAASAPSEAGPLVVFVVPDGRREPEPGAPFALERADGFIRSGLADRRGVVFERDTPAGEVRLLAPGALAR